MKNPTPLCRSQIFLKVYFYGCVKECLWLLGWRAFSTPEVRLIGSQKYFYIQVGKKARFLKEKWPKIVLFLPSTSVTNFFISPLFSFVHAKCNLSDTQYQHYFPIFPSYYFPVLVDIWLLYIWHGWKASDIDDGG